MIEILPEHLIGTGGTRSCYHHPDDPDKCIKIDVRMDRGQTANEARYYRRLERIRPDLTFRHLPRFYGFVETSYGCGGVFDLIRDEVDGAVSRTLAYYLRVGAVAVGDPLWIRAHQEYLDLLFAEAVAIRDFNPGNVCVRRLKSGGYQFVTIDGIGHRDFIPLGDCCRAYARWKLRCQVRRKNFGSLMGIVSRYEWRRQERQKHGRGAPGP